jgi:gliding motility-associated-like protein
MLSNKCGIDFNSGAPVPIAGAMEQLEGLASATGPDGKLLFYTSGSTVWNSRHEVMANGTDLAPFFNEQVGVPTYSCTQGAVIVPMPDSSKYYIFSLTHNSQFAHSKLFYTVIDMKMNNCLGGVDPGRKGILLDENNLSEKMTAVRGNNCNIWVLVHDVVQPVFKSYEITNKGVNAVPVISNSGTILGPSDPGYLKEKYLYGAMKVSPDRTMLALGSFFDNGLVELHRFNATTGKVSDGQLLHDQQKAYSVCFSPDNTKLYTSCFEEPTGEIYQFDLSLPGITAIRNSRIVVTDNIITPGYTLKGDMQIGPDNKIYVGGFPVKNTTNNSLYYLNRPNEAGENCQFTGIPFAWPENGLKKGPEWAYPNDLPVLVGHDTVYSRRLLSINGCSLRNPVLVPLPDGRDILWNGKSLCGPPVITDTGTYVMQYLAPGCIYHIDTFIVPSVPKLTSAAACATPNNFARMQPARGDTRSWQYNWLNAAGLPIRTYTGNNGDEMGGLSSSNYAVRLSNLDGCDTSISFTIVAPPFISFNSNGHDTICLGDSIRFNSLTTTEPINAYYWNFDDNSTSNEKQISHLYKRAGTYQVTHYAKSTEGCASNTLQTEVVVHPLPDVTAGPDLTTVEGRPVRLEGATRTASARILWQPSVYLSDINIVQPLATPPQTQVYHLYISGATGCTASDSVIVNVFPDLRIPNSFSPNGDGVHDLWAIPALAAYPASVIRIFNRWGQPVFESTGYRKPWDGAMKGMPLPMGTYYYVINLQPGVQKPVTGIITLLR